MTGYTVRVKLPDFTATQQVLDRAIQNATEAIARQVHAELREFWLDAPEGTSPDRLHRRTGQLADTSFIRSENNGHRQVIAFPADYAVHHHGPGTRDVFSQPFRRRGNELLRDMAELIRRQI